MDIINFFVLGSIPNSICKQHIIEILKNAKKGKRWAFQMLDATPKLPVGLLTGNGFQYGNYEECIDVKASGDFGNFTGKHCLVDFKLPLPQKFISTQVEEFAKYRWTICMPSTCRAMDITYLLKYGLHLPAEVTEKGCITSLTSWPYKPREIFTLCVIAFLLIMIVLSTLYDHLKTGSKNELCQAFSITRNFKTMLDMRTAPGTIVSLHGVRFSCTIGVILAHVYMCVGIGANINLLRFTHWLSDWEHTFITSRGIMLDAFFLLGGFLVSYTYMKDRDSGKKFNLLTYILHRFLRIAPAMYMVLLFVATFSNRLSKAPLWRTYSLGNEESCRKSWWKHILFLQSWFGNLNCLEHAWYLSVDMQLFIISPIMLYPLHRWPRVGIVITISTIVLTFFGSFASSYLYRENVDLFRNAFKIERDLYELAYNRLGPWAIGILCGYFAYKNRHMGKKITDAENQRKSPSALCKKYIITCVLLSISFALGLGVMAAVHPFIQPEYEYKAFESSLYLASSHIMASLAVLVMFVILLSGYGGPFEILFSAKFYVPLGRLSYSIFLIHLTVLKVWYIGATGPNFLNDYNVVSVWLSIVLYCVLFSPILFLMVEQPFIVIDRIIMKKLYGVTPKPRLEFNESTPHDAIPISELEPSCYINNVLEPSENWNGGLRQKKINQN